MATFRSKYRGLLLEDAQGIWAAFVPQRDPDTGAPLAYGEFTTTDETVADRLRACDDVDEVTDIPPHSPPADQAPDTDPDASPAPPPADAPIQPPLHGKGSGRTEWAAYADALGIEVLEADGRDDIVAAVKTAGHPVG